MATCKVGKLLGRSRLLGRADRALLRAWCDTGTADGRKVPATTMAAALTRNGHQVSATTLKDHRGRRCACWREDVDA
jgi:hypothetical protein